MQQLCYNFIVKKVVLLVFLFFLFILAPKGIFAQSNPEYIEAKVVGIAEESIIIESDGFKHPYQKLRFIGESGSLKEKTFILENGQYNQSTIVKYKVGDRLVLTNTKGDSGNQLLITDYVRTSPLLLLAVIFVLVTVIIGGRRGGLSLIGMLLTFVAIFAFVLPQISSGQNPILVTSVAALVVIPLSFLLAHGFNIKTFCAMGSTFIVLIFTGLLSQFFIKYAHLTGYVSEEAAFLNTIKQGNFDASGLLFAGIIIALLGILEDITIAQSAIVVQLEKVNKKLSVIDLFRRAMDVGRDHIASMANTLILVYAGASLPLLLLFVNSSVPITQVFNSEIVAEEIVRTLTASIGLILAVPIATLLTVIVVKRKSF